jgi:hypothetical protein
MKLRMKIRWRIAGLVDRLPGQCWSDLVDWAMRDRRDDPGRGIDLPWKPMGNCRRDAARVGACYCGKLRATSDGDA